eukprot:COSAG02_NODE_15132_length_1201_cov_0.927405_2_plen_49_part_00
MQPTGTCTVGFDWYCYWYTLDTCGHGIMPLAWNCFISAIDAIEIRALY